MAVAAPRSRPAPTAAKAPARKSASTPTHAATAAAPAGAHAGHHGGPALKLVAATEKDPRFKKAIDRLNYNAHKEKQHPPSKKEADAAEAAAKAPPNEQMAGAQANKVDAMEEAKAGKKPETKSFLEMLRAEIQKVMPKKTEDAGDFMKGDDREQLKSAMTGNVQEQKSKTTKEIDSANQAPLDPNTVKEQKDTPLPSLPAPAMPPPIGAAGAMPERRPESDVTLQPAKQDTDRLLKDADVTPRQLQKANDPRFSAVLTAKSEADRYADTAPKGFRATEQNVLVTAAAKATADEHHGLAGMQAVKGHTGKSVRAHQLTAQEKDEAARKKVVADIQKMFDKTKKNVDDKLTALDTDVTAMFDKGADAAVQKMRDYVDVRFKDRYSGWGGKALKLKDWAFPLPHKVKVWFDEAYEVFQQELDALVVRVANLVETRLKEAHDEIERGQREIHTYVEGLKGSLKSVGTAAEKDVQGRFKELSQGIDDKRTDLAEKLAQKYRDATEKGAAALKEMRDAHKSMYERVRDAIGEVIEVLRHFKERITAILKKGWETIRLIIADPIGFLGNLLAAIAKGVRQFIGNIWQHLKAGFMAWLFGSIAETGIAIPKDFSLGSLLMLVLSVLGLTYDRLRAKAVKLIGERNVELIERVAGLIKELITNPAQFWETIKEYLSNLKEIIFDAIKSWLETTIIQAAVIKLLTMFNPVGAIIQAILMIYNTVMFFIERINQILAFVEAIIDSIHNIAIGAIDAAANWVEQALARTIPLIIAFLARLLGISGIAEKIQGIIKRLQSRVDEAVDLVIDWTVGKAKGLFAKGSGKKRDDAKDGDDSKDVKAKVARELRGKVITSKEQEDQLVDQIYGKYRGQGLASIRISRSLDDPWTLEAWVSASLEEKVASMPKSKQLVPIAIGLLPYNKTTTLYVFIAGSKPFPPNGHPFVSGRGKHAEERFRDNIPALLDRIAFLRDRERLNVPDPVPISIDINRTPCDNRCVPIIESIATSNKDRLKITIISTSIYKQVGGLWNIELTSIPGLVRLRKAGVVIQASHIWDNLYRLIEEQGKALEIVVNGRWVSLEDANAARDVLQERIDAAEAVFKKDTTDKPSQKGG